MERVALVVDDSMLIRHTVCRFLEERGYAVESASDGLEALHILRSVVPSLIVTDLQMPRMSGTELMQELRQRPATAGIPVVVLTGDRRGSRAAELEFPHVVRKDIDIEAELNRVLAALSEVEALAAL